MLDLGRAAILTVCILATSIWVGGYVALVVMAKVSYRTLGPAERIVFFREMGKKFGPVCVIALAIALASGGALIASRGWGGPLIVVGVALAAALLAATAVGIAQARRMRALRQAALSRQGDDQLTRHVRRGTRFATALRATIGILTLALVATGALMAT